MAQIEPEPPSAVVDVAVKPDDSDSPPRPGSTLWSKPKAVVRIAGAEVSFAAFKSAAGLKKSGLSAEEFLLREPEGGFFIHCRWRLARFMESAPSRIFFLALVVMNGVTIGIQADYPDATVWDPVEYVFISIFCLELAAKMIGFGMTFWTEWWNILDFFIIGASLVEILLKLTVETKTSGISALRLMRVFRVVRLVGFLDKLNMLVQAFFEALKSVAWVMVLVAMVLYIAAVLAHGFFAEYTTPHCPSGNRTDCIHSWFATVMLSFLTLFQIMTLDSWGEMARLIGENNATAWIFFVPFVALAGLGLMNLLTAVFVEALMEQTKAHAQKLKWQKEQDRTNTLAQISEAFQEFDVDHGGTLDEQELAEAMKMLESEEAKKTFAQIGLPVEQIQEATKHAVREDDGGIDYRKFLHKVDQMDKPADKRDTWELDSRLRSVETKVASELDSRLRKVETHVASIDIKISEVLRLLGAPGEGPLTTPRKLPELRSPRAPSLEPMSSEDNKRAIDSP